MSIDRITALFRRTGRLFKIRTRLEAFAVIYALALGASERGSHYLEQFPGAGGALLFVACLLAVVMAGARIFDALRYEQSGKAPVPAEIDPGAARARSAEHDAERLPRHD